jgi:hypothetical protein
MDSYGNTRRTLCRLGQLAAAVGMLGCAATPASAYLLNKASSCSPGQKWDTSRPVQVRLLADSAFDYFNNWRGNATLADLTRLDADLKAVVDLYNSIPGSRLRLELGQGISGDIDLREPEDENYGTQTIVIGFTTLSAQSSATAEAWAPGADSDGCTRTRGHILFRKTFNWIFGPPDDTTADGRSFYTAVQTKVGSSLPRSFLGILTHEMGHVVGLGHPDDDYAVMAQGFRTWFRAPGHVLRTRLLPDDTAGVLALYGNASATKPLDVSVSNSWYKSAEAQFKDCTTEIAAVNAAAAAIRRASGLPVDADFPAQNIFKGDYAALFATLASAQDVLQACEDGKNAMQIDYCKVSSRGDQWADRLETDGAFCGVNTKGSAYPPVSDRICPGAPLQLRYSLNNHTSLRDVLVKSEVWFSSDTRLNAMDGSDTQSSDIREFTVKAADSATIGQVFKVPASIPSGQTRYVFVRAVPHDVSTGASLWNSDAEPWNNAIMMRHAIAIDASVCR